MTKDTSLAHVPTDRSKGAAISVLPGNRYAPPLPQLQVRAGTHQATSRARNCWGEGKLVGCEATVDGAIRATAITGMLCYDRYPRQQVLTDRTISPTMHKLCTSPRFVSSNMTATHRHRWGGQEPELLAVLAGNVQGDV